MRPSPRPFVAGAAIAVLVFSAPAPSCAAGPFAPRTYRIDAVLLQGAERGPKPSCAVPQVGLALPADWQDAEQRAALAKAVGAVDARLLWTDLSPAGYDAGFSVGREKMFVGFRTARPAEDGHVVTLAVAAIGRGKQVNLDDVPVADGRTLAHAHPSPDSGRDCVLLAVTPVPPVERVGLENFLAIDGVKPVIVMGDVVAPKLVKKRQPEHPDHCSGKIITQAVIDTQGRVPWVRFLKLPKDCDAAVATTIDALLEWRYEPARRGDTVVPAYFTVVFTYAGWD